ncbi:MAG: hypothetical protein GYA24_02910 [Candidatus Lokiarchaeota archaeon]|nr:hypothetical protein [Candidatus Lokiarchaeota archaeon]
MASASEENRIFTLIENISNLGIKIEDLSSRTDILCNITRIYVKIAERTRNPEILRRALEHSNKVSKLVFDFNGLREQARVADATYRTMGMKIQALNLIAKIEEESRRIKDLSLRIEVLTDIAAILQALKETEKYEESIKRIIKSIETSTTPLVVKIDSYMIVYKHFIIVNDNKRANEILSIILVHLDNGIEHSQKGEILRTVVNMFIMIADMPQQDKIQQLIKAIELVKKYENLDDTDLIYGDIFKQLFTCENDDWLKQNLEWVASKIVAMEKSRIKIDSIFGFLTKIYADKIEFASDRIKDLLAVLDGIDKTKLGPSRYVAFMLMRVQLDGLFVDPALFFKGVETLLDELLHSSQFRKNLQEWVMQTLQGVITFFKLARPARVEYLEKGIGLTFNYALPDIKNEVLKFIILAMVEHAASTKDGELLDHCIDLSKKIEILDERIFVSVAIGHAFYELNNIPRAQDVISACLDELINITKPTSRIEARIQLARAIITRQYDVDGTLILLEDAVQDANLYLVKVTNKTVALHEIATEAMNVYITLFEAEEEAKRQKYNAIMTRAKEEIDTHTRKGIENAIKLYDDALDMMNGSTDRYEHAFITEQINRLRTYLQNFSETAPQQAIQPLQMESSQKDKFKVSKSDIGYKQSVLWRKKREMVYSVEITNNAKIQISELYCRIKKYAGEYLELMHDSVQKTQVLKPNGTFTCEFNFIAKRDVVPSKAIESDISFFDPVSESTVIIDLDPPSTSAQFKFFEPKTTTVDKFEKLRQKMEKKTHEIVIPFNVYLTWKKVTSLLKKLPFAVVQRDYNEIAGQFFGVLRLYAESRWPRMKRFSTLIQIVISGDGNEHESNVKLEFFIQDMPIFYNLLNMFQELIEVFECPNVECNAPLDKEKLVPDSYGTCKFCNQMFYLEANLAKLDKPLRLRTVTLQSLLDDSQSLDLVSKRIKQLKKDGMDEFLASFPVEAKEKYKIALEKVSKGEIKARDFLAESIKNGDDKLIQSILTRRD